MTRIRRGDILICRLETSFGIMGTALAWLRSFLTKRTQQVVFNGHSSSKVTVASGVPQGSVLGPLLFLLYTADIPLIASEHRIEAHFYADDGQLYLFGMAGEAESMISRVTECIADVDTWMSSNRLKLNSDKTQFIWLGSRYQRQKVDITSIQLWGRSVRRAFSISLILYLRHPWALTVYLIGFCVWPLPQSHYRLLIFSTCRYPNLKFPSNGNQVSSHRCQKLPSQNRVVTLGQYLSHPSYPGF